MHMRVYTNRNESVGQFIEVFTAVSIKLTVVCGLNPCSLMDLWRLFRGYLPSPAFSSKMEVEDSFEIDLPVY